MDKHSQDTTKLVVAYSRLKEEEQTIKFAANSKLPYINLVNYPFVADVLNLIPQDTAKKFNIVAFMKIGNLVRVATLNPFAEGLSEVMLAIGQNASVSFEPYICSKSSISYALERYDILIKKSPTAITNNKETDAQFYQKITNLKDLKDAISKVPVTEMLEILLAGAIALDASDIHLEPQSSYTSVRFRIDGKLIEIIEIPERTYNALLSRIKNSAKIKLDIKKIPQDGRFSIKSGDEDVDIRVSTIPSAYGETIVMRILVVKNILTLDQLGMSYDTQKAIMDAISKPQGLILFTGPTGSGKTTSLYAVIQILNNPEEKIVTIEDPVEYHFEGVEQVQINTSGGFDFADALRSILRQDPDIVMIGEIRDQETAEIAVNASLTGHMVLSTLHTNSAPSAFVRLLQMGVPKYLLMDAISLIVAQRLVRRICSVCHGQGCDNCHQTGYRGRILISEYYKPNEKSAELIQNEAPLSEFVKLFKNENYKTMLEDGLEKVSQGLTTESEVRSVTS